MLSAADGLSMSPAWVASLATEHQPAALADQLLIVRHLPRGFLSAESILRMLNIAAAGRPGIGI